MKFPHRLVRLVHMPLLYSRSNGEQNNVSSVIVSPRTLEASFSKRENFCVCASPFSHLFAFQSPFSHVHPSTTCHSPCISFTQCSQPRYSLTLDILPWPCTRWGFPSTWKLPLVCPGIWSEHQVFDLIRFLSAISCVETPELPMDTFLLRLLNRCLIILC